MPLLDVSSAIVKQVTDLPFSPALLSYYNFKIHPLESRLASYNHQIFSILIVFDGILAFAGLCLMQTLRVTTGKSEG